MNSVAETSPCDVSHERPRPSTVSLTIRSATWHCFAPGGREVSRQVGLRPRVLLIESAGERRDALRVFLEGNGYRVESAGNGTTGLRRAIAWRHQ